MGMNPQTSLATHRRSFLKGVTALAVKIQPEIEKMLGNSVNLNTVVVAIKRYAGLKATPGLSER